jgi:hypothetical protein
MTIKKLELETFAREEWRAQLEMLGEEYPLLPYTDASRNYSMVRRMKAENELHIPISLRSGYAVSTKIGKNANDMMEEEWEEFYNTLSAYLQYKYPDLYELIFAPDKSGSICE